MTRKTITVQEIRDTANRMLATPDSSLWLEAPGKNRKLAPAEALRMGITSLLEYVLHSTGNYQGFGYQDGQVYRIDAPDCQRTIIADETRRIYYQRTTTGPRR